MSFAVTGTTSCIHDEVDNSIFAKALSNNDIADIAPLSGLTELENLRLDGVGLTDISPLSRLKRLHALSLNGNEIVDLSALTGLMELDSLDLRDNRITDAEPLVENTGLDNGDMVNLRENPLDRASIDVHIPALVARGVDTQFTEILVTVDDGPALFNDNVFVLPVPEDLAADALPLSQYAVRFYEHFEDDFDLLFFLSNLDHGEDYTRYYLGEHISVGNEVEGIGMSRFFDSNWGSASRLQSVLHFPFYYAISVGPALHEVMHRWANFIVDEYAPHWGFTSANGQLGGFDANNLVHHGGGCYTAGDFTLAGYAHNIEPFSPIELYLAGFVGAEEVPDLLVAENASGLFDEQGNHVFCGQRIPDIHG